MKEGEQNPEYETRARELEELEPEEGDIVEKYMKGLDSLKIMIPEPVDVEIPGYAEAKIKIIELPFLKHIKVQRIMNEIHLATKESAEKFREMKMDELLAFQEGDWETTRLLILAICDNGMNPFVDEKFCDEHISESMALHIIHTYIMKFSIPIVLKRFGIQNFLGVVLGLSGTRTPETSTEVPL